MNWIVRLSLAFAFAMSDVAGTQDAVPIRECAEQSSVDADSDRLADDCEFALAATFAPFMTIRSGGCNWDSAQSRLAGGYFYAVQPIDSVVRIAYMPAYFRDCGWKGLKCWIPGVDCSPHDGDSEFVVVELREPHPASFVVSGIFLSAHCFGRSGKDCRWYRSEDLQPFRWRGASPVIWVSEGRHANYPTSHECDAGHHSLDTCDNHDTEYPFPVRREGNIGSRTASPWPHGCIPGGALSTARADLAIAECFWRPEARFGGWQKNARGVTGYYRYLDEIARF